MRKLSPIHQSSKWVSLYSPFEFHQSQCFGAETESKREIVRKKEEEEDDGEQTPSLIGTHTLSMLELFKSSSKGEDKSMAAPFYITHLLHFLLSFDLLFS